MTKTSRTLATSGNLGESSLSAGLEVIACPSPGVCMGVGAQGFGTPGHEIAAVSTDGGLRWASTTPLPGVTHLDSMACATSTSCLSVGSNLVGSALQSVAVSTADGGRTWTTMSDLPNDVTQLESITCPIATSCMAVGTSSDQDRGIAFVTDASGSRWHPISLPNGVSDPSLVSCATSQVCVIEGRREAVLGDPSAGEELSIIHISDGGETWANSTLPTGSSAAGAPDYKGLICLPSIRCLLVGDSTPPDGTPTGMILASSDGGNTWATVTPPPETTFLNAIACPTTTGCVLVGGGVEGRGGSVQDILTTSSGGEDWVSRPVPANVVGLISVSCASTSSCLAVGFGPSTQPSGLHSVVARTSDGGATWSALQ